MAGIERTRVQIVQQAKALITYAEGPGEIDSLLEDALRKLTDVMTLMKDAHWRAIHERELAAKVEARRAAAPRVMKPETFSEAFARFAKADPEAARTMLKSYAP
jgi:hypothetical protein